MMINPMDLTGKKIIVAGASSGIGKQTAITLSQLGARIVLMARSEDRLNAVMNELKPQSEKHARYSMDLSDTESIENLIERVVCEIGKIDGLVYSAGITVDRPLRQLNPSAMQKQFGINLFGFIELSRQICRKGRYNKGLRIVGVSSTAAHRGAKAHEAYSASKAAMESAIRCMARELAANEISINAVAPGMVATRMYDEYLKNNGEESKANRGLLARQYGGIVPPQDVANAIAFLISSAARSITGTTLMVDNGLTSN